MKKITRRSFLKAAAAVSAMGALSACGAAAGSTAASSAAASSAAASTASSTASSAAASAPAAASALKDKWAALAGTHLTVGTSCVQTGWSQDDGSGNPEGMDVDVMQYICDYYGLELEWYVAEYASLWGCVQNGMIDTIANLTTVNPDRLELYWFTNTYAWESYSIVSRAADDKPEDGDMDYWGDKTICGEAGSNATMTFETIMEEEKGKGITINELTLDAAALLVPAVVQGQADGAFMCTSTCGYIVDTMGYSDTCYIQNVEWKNMPIVYGFARDDAKKDLILAFNDLIAEMHDDGTLAEFSDKWFGMDVTALPDGEVNTVTTTGDNAWQSYEG